MGLDIFVYRKIRKVSDYPGDGIQEKIFSLETGCPEGAKVFSVIPSSDFPNQADGLTEGVYTAEGNDFGGAELIFKAGSYGSYNDWRNDLAELFGDSVSDEQKPGSPFGDIIHFSDCEGCFGPKTSKKLYKDFTKYLSLAKKQPNDDRFLETYLLFMEAFKIASDDGCVVFA